MRRKTNDLSLLKAVVTLIAFAAIASSPALAVDTPTIPGTITGQSTYGFTFMEGTGVFGGASSYLVGSEAFDGRTTGPTSWLCASLTDLHCTSKSIVNYWAQSIAAPCEVDSTLACIDSFSVIDESGITHVGKFGRLIKAPTFVGSPTNGLTNGSSISLWSTQDLPDVNDFSIEYVVASGAGVNPISTPKFDTKFYSLTLRPFIQRNVSDAKEHTFFESKYPDGRQGISGGGGSTNSNCAWTENQTCGIEQEFNPKLRYKVVIRVPKTVTGWLNGRLIDPNVQITSYNAVLNLVSIEGRAADVPLAFASVPYAETNDKMKELYRNNAHAMAGMSVGDVAQTNSEQAFKYMDAFKDYLHDKSPLKISRWIVNSLQQDERFPSNACLASNDKLMGLVTTNSMIYIGGPPTFENGSLNYKVGGLHFNPDGTPFQGMYDLVLRSDTARCLYHFSNAPIQAEISVISDDGTKQITTTTVKEENGWLHLGAYGFTFSSPKISVKFTQPVSTPEVINPTPTPSMPSNVNPSARPQPKLLSFTCVKGKTKVKKVAAKYVCPAGFKLVK